MPVPPVGRVLGRLGAWLPWLLAAGVAVWGWQATCFLCDDAFIHFRYVANAHAGVGFVWNAAPFHPVEGVTSTLWPLMLLAAWSWFGVEPPQSANPMSFVCGLATLYLVAARLQRMHLPERWQSWRPILATIVLVTIAGNYTWITWQSSGLESALFCLAGVGWTLQLTGGGPEPSPGRLACTCGWAAVAQCTRPDGALLVAATVLVIVWFGWRHRSSWLRRCAPLLPLALPAAQFVWRRLTYGEWLPNTYYAKVDGSWAESGLRYFFCFALEHGLWLWLLLVALWLPRSIRRVNPRSWLSTATPGVVVAATWLAHTSYYVLVVGGDHFAYRPFLVLVPLTTLAALGMAVVVFANGLRAASFLLTLAVAANSFGWFHEHAHRGERAQQFVAVAPHVPAFVRPVFRLYDRCQAWLRVHHVGLKRGNLARFGEEMQAMLPPRGTPVIGAKPGVRMVFHGWAIGVLGWVLPDVAIIDMLGLNDWVIARNPGMRPAFELPEAARLELFAASDGNGDDRLDADELARLSQRADPGSMGVEMDPASWAALWLAGFDEDADGIDRDEFAHLIAQGVRQTRLINHSRQAPEGYAEALRANVVFRGGRFEVDPAVTPLSDDEIRSTEQRYRARSAR
ncbi:MAG: EF-hand domain-containing protein [Planctomycetes bacterium]|nr:EF-hand domain-containing protein [Planctomycetota bacterium]